MGVRRADAPPARSPRESSVQLRLPQTRTSRLPCQPISEQVLGREASTRSVYSTSRSQGLAYSSCRLLRWCHFVWCHYRPACT